MTTFTNPTRLILLVILGTGFWMQWQVFQWDYSPPPGSYESLQNQLPEPLTLDREQFSRSEAYRRPIKTGLLWQYLTSMTGIVIWMWAGAGRPTESRWGRTMARWGMRLGWVLLLFVSLWVLRFPYRLGFYMHGVSFGRTVMDPESWMAYLLYQSWVPMFLFCGKQLILFCLFFLAGRNWWWVTSLVFLIVFSLIPEVTSRQVPLDPTIKWTPLQQSAYLDAVQEIAEKSGQELTVFIEDSSHRTLQVSAYLTGRTGRNYAVITDTLLHGFTPQEVAMVIAHELAHKRHAWRYGFLFTSLSYLELLTSLGLAWLLFGRKAIPERDRLHVLVVIMLCCMCMHLVWSPVINRVSRWNEWEADRLALQWIPSPKDYQNMLVKMAKINHKPLDMPWWEMIWMSRHPTTLQRIIFLEEMKGNTLQSGVSRS